MTRDLQPGSLHSVGLTCLLQPRYIPNYVHTKESRQSCKSSNVFYLCRLLTQVPPQLPSWFSALARGGVSGQRGMSLIARSLVSGVGSQAEGSRLTGASWSPPSPSLQDEPSLPSRLSEPQDPVSSEKTTVNHSSPASANQVDGARGSAGNRIKTETLEDD